MSGAQAERLVSQRPLIAVVGPTAAGKTALALRLAEELGGEILSCDALQIRAGLPLLTAKPSAAELARVRHHLVGVLPIDQPATAAHYAELADAVLAELAQRDTLAILCGGTGLYLRALCEGLFPGPGGDPELRQRLRDEAAAQGTAALHGRLAAVDPAAAARIAANDYVRIERALEVFMLSGRPMSEWQADSQRERARGPRYRVLKLALDLGVEPVRARIRARVQHMLDGGLLAEVEASLAADGPLRYPPLGYEQVCRALRGELTLDALATDIAQKTAQYARRQRTWFRADPQVRWFSDPAQVQLAELRTALAELGS